MIRKVANCLAKDGIQRKTSGENLLSWLIHEKFIFVFFRTILLSVISLLNEPNTSSPANVDASVMYRRWKETKGKDKEYENIIRWVFDPFLDFYLNYSLKFSPKFTQITILGNKWVQVD